MRRHDGRFDPCWKPNCRLKWTTWTSLSADEAHVLRVINALARKVDVAAGGAAHLPGMTAAMTPLPVFGVPVESKALSGMDSELAAAVEQSVAAAAQIEVDVADA